MGLADRGMDNPVFVSQHVPDWGIRRCRQSESSVDLTLASPVPGLPPGSLDASFSTGYVKRHSVQPKGA